MLERIYKALLCAGLFSLPMTVSGMQKENYSIHVSCPGRNLEGMVFSLENSLHHEIQEITVNEEGTGYAELEKGTYYLTQKSEFKGVLPLKEPLLLETETELQLIPLSKKMEVEGREKTEWILKDEKTEEVTEWTCEKEMDIGKELIYGHFYTLQQKETYENCMDKPPVVFKATEEDEKTVYTYRKAYPVTLDSETDCSVHLYRDKKAEESVLDRKGKPVILKSGQTYFLEEGTYFYKYEIIDNSFYFEEDIQSLDVKEEPVSIVPLLEKSRLYVQCDFEAPYIFTLYNEQKEIVQEWKNEGGLKELFVPRESTYTIRSNGIEGYYPVDGTEVKTSRRKEQQEICNIEAHPFTVCIEVVDMDNRQSAKGAVVRVENRTQETVQDVQIEEGRIEVNGIFPSDILRVQVTEVPQGYMFNDSVREMEITEDTYFLFSFSLQPYACVEAIFPDTAKEVLYGVYEDAQCTMLARDISGKEAYFSPLQQYLSLPNGKYYVRQIRCEDTFYTDRTTYPLSVETAQARTYSIPVSMTQCLVSLSAKRTDTSDYVSDIPLILKNEQGEILEKWNSDQEKTLTLKKENVYILEMEKEITDYLSVSSVRFRMEDKEKLTQHYSLPLQKLYALYMQCEAEEDIEYGIFEDADCRRQVKDRYGNPAVLHSGKDEKIYLTEKICYARQLNSPERYFQSPRIEEIHLKEEEAFCLAVEPVKAGFCVQIQDEEGNAVEDSIWKVLNEQRECLFVSEGESRFTMQAPWILCGEKYTLVPESIPEKYRKQKKEIVYTVGSRQLEQGMLTITLEERKVQTGSVQKRKPTDSSEKNSGGWMAGFLLIPVLLGGIGILKRKKW